MATVQENSLMRAGGGMSTPHCADKHKPKQTVKRLPYERHDDERHADMYTLCTVASVTCGEGRGRSVVLIRGPTHKRLRITNLRRTQSSL